MPFTYGGGIRTIEDASRLFSLGVEKLSLQTAIFEAPDLVRQVSSQFGQQSIVFSLDVMRNRKGNPHTFLASKDRLLKPDLSELVAEVVSMGVGEILLTAVHKEGTFGGPDLELVRLVTSVSSIPVIAAGGVSSLKDIREMIEAGASAVGAGSFFVFSGPHRAVLLTYPRYTDLESLVGNTDNKGAMWTKNF